MKVKAPFRIASRIPPYRKAQEWNKRLKMAVYGCQAVAGHPYPEQLQSICWHWVNTAWRLTWSGGGTRSGHYRDHSKERW